MIVSLLHQKKLGLLSGKYQNSSICKKLLTHLQFISLPGNY